MLSRTLGSVLAVASMIIVGAVLFGSQNAADQSGNGESYASASASPVRGYLVSACIRSQSKRVFDNSQILWEYGDRKGGPEKMQARHIITLDELGSEWCLGWRINDVRTPKRDTDWLPYSDAPPTRVMLAVRGAITNGEVFVDVEIKDAATGDIVGDVGDVGSGSASCTLVRNPRGWACV